MARKVKFPLDMGNEVFVRSLSELKENYNSEKVTEYFLDGRLLTWLNDRYYEEEAAQVQELTEQDNKENLAAKLGKIFGVEIADEVDIENLEIRREKLEKLRLITSDDSILENADFAAFSQEELGDLLDENPEFVYLCGGDFRVPLGVKNIRYIGVNNPVVSIGGKGEIDLDANGISFENCKFSEDTKARLAVKEEVKEIVKHNDVTVNKDPLYLKSNEAGFHIVNSFVDIYHLHTPNPVTVEQMRAKYVESVFRDRDKIVLTGDYLNFTYSNEDRKFAKVVTAQNKHVANTIEKQGHILCYTENNKKAFASGCLFNIGLNSHTIMWQPFSSGKLQIYINPEKYTEFLEKFAVTSVITIPCKENVSITALERMAYNKNPALNDIVPLIYIDMGKVVNDMCERLGRTIGSLERYSMFFNLGDYGIYRHSSEYSDISDFEYMGYNSIPDTSDAFEKRYTNNIFTATDNYVSAIMNLLK